MNGRLYYEDAYRTNFEAKVIRHGEEEGKTYVVLDRTVFYPTGGGQPHDTGTLNDIPVYDVEEVDGEIRHYVAQPIETNVVHGEIDWARRFDLMQQHSGQHIVTAFFQDYYGYETDGFHLGEEVVTIDLNAPSIPQAIVDLVEDQANRAIARDIPIEARWVKRENLERYPLRKPIEHEGPIRLVIMPEVDYNGCGGTHPRSTGEIQMIKILSTEREKQKTRVTFVCGDRARAYLHKQNERVKTYAKLLATSEERVENKIKRLIEEKEQLLDEMKTLRNAYYELEAQRLYEQSDGVIAQSFVGQTIQSLQQFANVIIERYDDSIVLFTTQNEDVVQLVAARGERATPNMREIGKVIFPYFGGRGGGSPHFIQGGGQSDQTAEDVLTQLRMLVE